jgi:hypothetical protein
MTDYFKNAALSEASKKQYNKYIVLWLKLGFKSMKEVITSPVEAMKALEGSTIPQTPTSRHNYISAAVAYIWHCVPLDHQARFKKTWKDLQVTNKKPIDERVINQEPTEAQKKNAVSWKQVIEAREKNPDNLLLAFYTYIPPVRADYNKVYLLKPTDPIPKNENYILMDKEYKLVLQEFKTAKTYKTIEHSIPEELKKIMDKSLSNNLRSYLFVSPITGEPQSASRFAEWAGTQLSKLIGKKTTLTALRHAFTHTIDYNQAYKDLKAITNGMGHSVERSMMYKQKAE